MAAEGARDVSISEYGVVLEVYELEDSPLQDCMRLVLQFNETSLGTKESKKASLIDLLAKTQKRWSRLKATLRAFREEVDGLRAQTEDTDEQIRLLNARLKKERQKLTVATEESEERIISLKNLLNAQRTEMEELKTRSNAEIQKLRDELAQRNADPSSNVGVHEMISELERQIEKGLQLKQELTKSRDDAWTDAANTNSQMEQLRCRYVNEFIESSVV